MKFHVKITASKIPTIEQKIDINHMREIKRCMLLHGLEVTFDFVLLGYSYTHYTTSISDGF